MVTNFFVDVLIPFFILISISFTTSLIVFSLVTYFWNKFAEYRRMRDEFLEDV
jgi:hypothetical protein